MIASRAFAVSAIAIAVGCCLLFALVDSDDGLARGSKPNVVVVEPGQFTSTAQFSATYTGSGANRTVFHAEPPNEGGDPDANDARDSSTQDWSLKFDGRLSIPECAPSARAKADPCSSLAGLTGAAGLTRLKSRIDHTHVDGLFDELDLEVSCTLRGRTRVSRPPEASIFASYDAAAEMIGLTAVDPVSGALSVFPMACPEHPDGIDRMASNYATPGFSFAPDWGPERWFGSRTIWIPAETFHRAARITINLADTRAGRPPRDCTVPDPSFERCRTSGNWSGVLTLKRRGGG